MLVPDLGNSLGHLFVLWAIGVLELFEVSNKMIYGECLPLNQCGWVNLEHLASLSRILSQRAILIEYQTVLPLYKYVKCIVMILIEQPWRWQQDC